MKKKSKNTSQTNNKVNTTTKTTYNLDEYRSKKTNGPTYKKQTHSYGTYNSPYNVESTSGKTSNKSSNKPINKAANRVVSKESSKEKPTDKSASRRKNHTNETAKSTNRYTTNNNYYNSSYGSTYGSYTAQNHTSQSNKSPEIVREEIRQKNKISRKEAEQLKKRKKAHYRRQVVFVICIVMFGVYGAIKLVDMFRYPTVSYQTVRVGMIDNSQRVQGVIVREEKVYTSSGEGNIHYLTGEGQKVKKGGEVSYITQDEQLDEVVNQIEEVDNSIYNIQDKRENLSEYQVEIHALNSSITNEIRDFHSNRSLEKTNTVYTLRKQLDRMVQTRTDLYVNEPNNRTESLQQDRENLTNELKNYHEIVYSKEAGTVSYIIDGQESILNSSTIGELDYATYQKVLKSDHTNESNKSVSQTEKDAPLYKLVLDDKWQIITYVDTEQAKGFTQGEKYDLIFKDIGNTTVNFTLQDKIEEENKVKLVFSSRDQMIKFLPYRTVEFTIGENKADGLKIPLSAVVEKNVLSVPNEYITTPDKNQGVMKQVGELMQFVPISIQYKDEEYSYILQDLNDLNSIQVNDIIIHPETKESLKVSEVSTVKGVYTINGRYAKFKQIDIILTNEDYAIIKQNSQLKEFDQIISNPKSIKEDQLLKSMNIQNE